MSTSSDGQLCLFISYPEKSQMCVMRVQYHTSFSEQVSHLCYQPPSWSTVLYLHKCAPSLTHIWSEGYHVVCRTVAGKEW